MDSGRVEAANFAEILCFCTIRMFDMPALRHFLSNFVRVKNNVSPRPSTLTYPQEIFDLTNPLNSAGLHVAHKYSFYSILIFRVPLVRSRKSVKICPVS